MVDIEFLGLDDILEIHRDQVQRYGGSPGIRDIGLLQSAVAAPAASFDGQYLHHDIYEMAAAYLFHITQNHPFIDGNKRTGAAAAIVFLEINDVALNADEEELERLVRGVATGESDRAVVAVFFRSNCNT